MRTLTFALVALLFALGIGLRLYDLTDQPIALGGIGLARLIPVILFSLIGGAVADTLDRRTIIFITQSVMALVALCLAILTLQGTITVWLIYLLTAIQAMAAIWDSFSAGVFATFTEAAKAVADVWKKTTTAIGIRFAIVKSGNAFTRRHHPNSKTIS